MEDRLALAFYGASLFLAGVEISLRDKPELEVVRVDNTLPTVGLLEKPGKPIRLQPWDERQISFAHLCSNRHLGETRLGETH